MTPEDVLSHPPRTLSKTPRDFDFENGYLAVERFVDGKWLERLCRISLELVEKTMRKRFESPPAPDASPRDRGTGARLARIFAIASLAMLIAGCTGLVPGLPI